MPDIYSANYSTPGMSASTHETPQNQFCCTYDDVLLNLEQPISIVSAEKTLRWIILLYCLSHSFFVQVFFRLVVRTYEARRRYSEFESLRDALAKLYPTVLVPPIPDKHSIAQYATKHTRAKEDMHIIEKRKRIASILSQQNRRPPNPCF
ncbi:Sorting nexin, cytoplasm-to-vacuole targeting pathway/endosomal sorting [Entomophthora muscae]|uniref:Sorting nexin, cytoplasm-to-vacuole targeting pathway/endosomal sorting n=1 Tax=Entomophthora muscae TaxID=34485 RepID=A0ACC2RI40_9FUNG|nr:Sorting nexin, cytoplasm-to-vacuole targeting pathway/endosomal sorting [Entomophthora muscae]